MFRYWVWTCSGACRRVLTVVLLLAAQPACCLQPVIFPNPDFPHIIFSFVSPHPPPTIAVLVSIVSYITSIPFCLASWFGQQSRVLLLFCFLFIVSCFIVVGELRFKRFSSQCSSSVFVFSLLILQVGVFLLSFWLETENCGSVTTSRPNEGKKQPIRTKCRGCSEILSEILHYNSCRVWLEGCNDRLSGSVKRQANIEWLVDKDLEGTERRLCHNGWNFSKDTEKP